MRVASMCLVVVCACGGGSSRTEVQQEPSQVDAAADPPPVPQDEAGVVVPDAAMEAAADGGLPPVADAAPEATVDADPPQDAAPDVVQPPVDAGDPYVACRVAACASACGSMYGCGPLPFDCGDAKCRAMEDAQGYFVCGDNGHTNQCGHQCANLSFNTANFLACQAVGIGNPVYITDGACVAYPYLTDPSGQPTQTRVKGTESCKIGTGPVGAILCCPQ